MKKELLRDKPARYNASATRILHYEISATERAFRLHWHNGMEILRIQSGKLCVEYETKQVILSPGELMVISPKALHMGYAMNEPVKYDVLMFDVRSFYNDTEVCKKMLPPIFDGRAVFQSITADKETIACFDEIHRVELTDELQRTAQIYKLISLLYQKHLLELRSKSKTAAVQKIMDYIEENFAQEINMEMLCEKFGYSAAHLCRKFKAATGLTPMTYLKIFRLECASKKIRNRECGIGDIAAECGFADANYFTRCFKAHFGVAPTKFD